MKQSVIEQKAEKKKQASQAPTTTKRARSIRFSLDSPELHDVKQLDEQEATHQANTGGGVEIMLLESLENSPIKIIRSSATS